MFNIPLPQVKCVPSILSKSALFTTKLFSLMWEKGIKKEKNHMGNKWIFIKIIWEISIRVN